MQIQTTEKIDADILSKKIDQEIAVVTCHKFFASKLPRWCISCYRIHFKKRGWGNKSQIPVGVSFDLFAQPFSNIY